MSHSIEEQTNSKNVNISVEGQEKRVNKNQRILQLQNRGQISYQIVSMPRQRQSLKYLMDLKNLFSNQLPKMPKQYVTRLVLDKYHENLIMFNNRNEVIGGLCFRHFQQNQLVEIVFLAISTKQQVQGFGSRLMIQFKNYMQKRNVLYLMTYADNLALGYFRKQGFSKDIITPLDLWDGYIKDYEGGTKMEYWIDSKIDYLRINKIIQEQKNYFLSQLKKICLNNTTYKIQRLCKQPYKRINSDGSQVVLNLDPQKLKGLKQSGWSWQQYQLIRSFPTVTFLSECNKLVMQLQSHSLSWPFRQPVHESIVQYRQIIKKPMDISTIHKNLNNSKYQGCEDFSKDVLLIFSNCKEFNQTSTVYYRNAVQLEKIFIPKLEKLKQWAMKSQ